MAILAMWFTILNVVGNNNSDEAIITTTGIIAFVALCVSAVIYIGIAIYTQKKIIVPTSRMLKSANLTDLEKLPKTEAEIEQLVGELKERLQTSTRQINETNAILSQLNDGVITFNMDGKVTYINPEAKHLLELRDTDDTFNKVFEKYEEDINMEKIIYLENWTSSDQQLNNNVGTMRLSFVPFKDDINRPTGVMVVVQDITESVKLDDMRKTFVADVSHELKTPLTSIKGFSETLLDGVEDTEQQERFLKIIYENAVRMEKLVQDLLTLSKYDKKKEIKVTTFDIGKLAKACVEKFEIEVKKKNQKMQCFVTAKIPEVKGDIDGIERVIINIISNSVKYTPDGGSIDVYVGYLHNYAYVKIKDTGIGISKKDLERVFDRFYRVDKARSREMGGTGLGLSIAKQIMEQNGGTIDIKSEVAKGTEVTLKIPVEK